MTFNKLNICNIMNHQNCVFNNQDINLNKNNVGINNFYVQEIDYVKDININSISFKCAKEEKNNFDNFYCCKQKININDKENYSNIALLGFSEFNTAIDKLIIQYVDKTIQEELIAFYSEFAIDITSTYDEEVSKLIQGNISFKSNTNIPLKYYVNVINLDKNKLIKDITFPDNFEIHICSITLF